MKQFDTWHKTKSGLFTFLVLEVVLVYVFGSLAIDRGNLWWYLISIVFLIGSIQNFFRLIGKFIHGKQHAS